MTDDLLELKNVNKKYENGFHAVKDVSFSIKPGLLVGSFGGITGGNRMLDGILRSCSWMIMEMRLTESMSMVLKRSELTSSWECTVSFNHLEN